MKLLLYEWCCSGGLADREANADLAGIAAEGRAMLEALVADAVRDGGLEVTVLVDRMQPIELPGAVRAVGVRDDDVAALVAAAREADWTVIVAPETDGILRSRVAAVRATGGRVLGADERFIEIAADKQATVDALAAAGVPVPAGRALAAGERVPAGFHMPAVLKARDGIGCEGFRVCALPPPGLVERDSRLEAFVPGIPVGVSCLCGPGGIVVLEPMRQLFAAADPPRYVGGEPLESGRVCDRARSLARRAVAAVLRAAGLGTEPSVGWVGVDMILGERDDGRADRVLEVNPRLTTSFARLATSSPRSLVRTMVHLAETASVRDGAS